MQTFAFTIAIVLMGLGALLNTLVLAYFVWRACRVLTFHRPRRKALPQRSLAPAHH